jgi:hypothetical protein
MKTLIIFALLLLPTLAFAQTQDLPCPGSVTNTWVGGYTITVTCTTGGVVPPPPPPPPPTGCSGMLPSGSNPTGFTGPYAEYTRFAPQVDTCYAYGSVTAGWKLRQAFIGEILYCQASEFQAITANFAKCWSK